MWNSINFVCCYTGCKHPLLWDISQHCDHLAIGRILDRKPQQPSISAVFTSLRSCSSGIGLPWEWNKAKWPNDGCLYSLAISWDMRRVIKNQLSWWSFKALECWTNRWWFPHFLFLSNTALKDHQRKEEAQFLWYTVCKNNKQTIFEGGSPWTTEILNSAGIEWCNYTSIGPSWPWRNRGHSHTATHAPRTGSRCQSRKHICYFFSMCFLFQRRKAQGAKNWMLVGSGSMDRNLDWLDRRGWIGTVIIDGGYPDRPDHPTIVTIRPSRLFQPSRKKP